MKQCQKGAFRMGRGHWVYYRHHGSCCGIPTCLLTIFTLPLWPFIGCYSMITEHRNKKVKADEEISDQ